MADPVNPTVDFHIDQIDRLLRSLQGSNRTYVVFAFIPIALAIAGFWLANTMAKPAVDTESQAIDYTKIMSTLIPLVSAYPLALIQSKKGHIVVLKGFREDLEGSLHSPTLTEEIKWVVAQIKNYIEKWLSGGSK